MLDNRFNVSLPDSLRQFLDGEREERGLESVDDCVEVLLREAWARRPATMVVDVEKGGDANHEGASENDAESVKCTLTRLRDDEFGELARTCIAIDDLHAVSLAMMRRDRPLLAQTYAVCMTCFGERGRLFDDWKGGFSFPLSVTIEGDDRQPAYLVNIYNYRSSVNFQILQTVEQDDPRLDGHQLYQHDDSRFPTEQLSFLIFYLIGFIKGYSKNFSWSSPFLLQVQTNLILYGYSPSEGFFNRQFEDHREYEAVRKTLSDTLPTPKFYSSA